MHKISIMTAGAILFALIGTAACTSPSASEREEAAHAVHAQCLVCKSEGDLACVDVTVRADTPRTVFHGTTYYFCSEQCRTDFEKDPQKYLPR
jgi:hypothetical protein